MPLAVGDFVYAPLTIIPEGSFFSSASMYSGQTGRVEAVEGGECMISVHGDTTRGVSERVAVLPVQVAESSLRVIPEGDAVLRVRVLAEGARNRYDATLSLNLPIGLQLIQRDARSLLERLEGANRRLHWEIGGLSSDEITGLCTDAHSLAEKIRNCLDIIGTRMGTQ